MAPKMKSIISQELNIKSQAMIAHMITWRALLLRPGLPPETIKVIPPPTTNKPAKGVDIYQTIKLYTLKINVKKSNSSQGQEGSCPQGTIEFTACGQETAKAMLGSKKINVAINANVLFFISCYFNFKNKIEMVPLEGLEPSTYGPKPYVLSNYTTGAGNSLR